MRIFSLSKAQRYALVLPGVAIAATIRMMLDPILGAELPLFIFAFPVILAAWYGGLGPGLFATFLSLLVGDFLFIAPRGTIFYFGDLLTLNRLSFLLFFGVVFSLLMEKIRNSVKVEMNHLERSRLLIEGVEDYAILMLDAQGRVVSWNSGAQRITGYREGEILGKDISIFYAPEDVEDGAPQRCLGGAAMEGRHEEEGWRARKDGSRYLAHVVTTAMWDQEGRLRGFAKVTHDVTRRKEIEEERERLLGQEKAAREEAEAASRTKDEFLSTLSHELRTPLTSILGWARMLTSGSVPEHQMRHAVEVIAKSAQSQTQLIDEILDTSRIITGRLRIETLPVEIERVFQSTLDVVRPSAAVKGVRLDVTVDSEGDLVLGDEVRLRQAIWNLLSNAVKFSSEGGTVAARLTREGNQIEIAVRDTGIGIEPQFLPHVFERFRQADGASTREYGGLGLGLAITRHIVEMHGGCVSAASPGKNQGATFKIRLPLAPASETPQPESRRPESEVKQIGVRRAAETRQRLDDVRLLLVEDNPETLEMLRYIFDDCGAEVITATSASEALDALERWRPDALITDIAMPNQDGYELIHRVRERRPEAGGKIPAIAVTAFAGAEDRVQALTSGFQMHVAKPIDPDELIAIVASLTGRIHF